MTHPVWQDSRIRETHDYSDYAILEPEQSGIGISGDRNLQLEVEEMKKQPMISYQLFNEKGFTKNDIYKNSNSTLFILNFLPGQQMPDHKHQGAELYFHVLEGSGTFRIDGKEVPVEKNDVIHCDGTEKLGFVNTGNENVSIYVTLCKINVSD